MDRTPQIILITGATSGIGHDAAVHLARRGHRVFATGRREPLLRALEAEQPGIEGRTLDVTDSASIDNLRAEIDRRTEGHGVDTLINNAGYGQPGSIEELSEADTRAQFETNVFGLLAVTRAFLPAMRARGSGRIINLSSVAGHVAMPLFGVYNATKYAVEALSDALRREMRPFGVQVVLIEPGIIRTEFDQRARERAEAYIRSDSAYAEQIAQLDSGRDRLQRMGSDTGCVVRAIDRAVHRRRPRARYMIPTRDRLFIWFIRSIPTRWADGLIGRVTGFRRR